MGYQYIFGILISLGIKLKVNDKLTNVTIREINYSENRIYIEHDTIIDLKNLIAGRSECFIKIDKILKLDIDCINNVCNIIYKED